MMAQSSLNSEKFAVNVNALEESEAGAVSSTVRPKRKRMLGLTKSVTAST